MQQAICAYNRRRDALADISIHIGLSTGDVSGRAGTASGHQCWRRPGWRPRPRAARSSARNMCA
jgi:hypothetical protein